jgi:serine/threonine protein kinase
LPGKLDEMAFLLSNQNAVEYLINRGFQQLKEKNLTQIEPKICKNFNLLLRFSDHPPLLVKQEPHDQNGCTSGDLFSEWCVHELLQARPALSSIRYLLSEAIHFEPDDSVIVFQYLDRYCDLDHFYSERKTFPSAIAACLGASLAKVHRHTFERQDYRQFLSQKLNESDDEKVGRVPDLNQNLRQISPEIFSTTAADGLQFYQLYQRYESLGKAIADLNSAYQPCCLIHNDLKLDNVLLHQEWESVFSDISDIRFAEFEQPKFSFSKSETGQSESIIRLIDWEKWSWGDPAFDLGRLIASYLKIWLNSLTARAGIDITTTLRFAGVPLERLQPSIVALTQTYLTHFPEILRRSDLLVRVMQFAGLNLISRIRAKLHYQEPFGNSDICILQVAKGLLCAPEQAIATVFGITASELLALETLNLSRDCVLVSPQSCIPQKPDAGNNPFKVERSPIPFSKPQTQAEMLQDLVTHIQIHPNGEITHPHYAPLEQLKQESDRPPYSDEPHQNLKVQLRNYLYDIYFSGEQEPIHSTDNENAASNVTSSSLVNNTWRGVNIQFYQQLHRNNKGKGYFDPGWQVLQGQNGRFAVKKEGLTVHIDSRKHLHPKARSPHIGDTVAIRLPRNRVEAGFYIAVGNAGMPSEESAAIELCFNLTPEGAIALMHHLTQQLNALLIPFSFKVLSDPDEYRRFDAGILTLEQHHYEKVRQILQDGFATAMLKSTHFHSPVPLFTKPLAPGIGLAEEPESDSRDFGMNRCELVAEALLAVWQTEQDSPEGRMSAIAQQFSQQGIDLQHPYLNPGSEDVYRVLK